MAIVRDVIESMEKWAPSQTAESWDNVGLQTGNDKQKIKSVIITLDITWETLERTRKLPFPMIITHHPIIFKPLKKLTSDNLSNKLIIEALSKNTPIFASHTNLDIAPGGVSFALAKKIGLKNISPLIPGNINLCKFVTFVPPEYTDRIREAMSSAGAGNIGNYSFCSFTVNGTGTFLPNESARPFKGSPGNMTKISEDRIEMTFPAFSAAKVLDAARKVHPYEEMAYDIIPLSVNDSLSGYGAVGNLENAVVTEEFLARVSSSLDVSHISYSGTGNDKIMKVAVMGGSGGDFIQNAVSSEAEAYVTGDLGHHDFTVYSSDIMLVDATHRATELPILPEIAEKLKTSEKLNNIEFIIDTGISSRYYSVF